MKNMLFTVPLKPGMHSAYQSFVAEITGPRKQEYASFLKRYGLKTAKVWSQKIGDREYIILYHDIEKEALDHLKKFYSSTDPFDLWFGKELGKCYDGDLKQAQQIFEFNAH